MSTTLSIFTCTFTMNFIVNFFLFNIIVMERAIFSYFNSRFSFYPLEFFNNKSSIILGFSLFILWFSFLPGVNWLFKIPHVYFELSIASFLVTTLECFQQIFDDDSQTKWVHPKVLLHLFAQSVIVLIELSLSMKFFSLNTHPLAHEKSEFSCHTKIKIKIIYYSLNSFFLILHRPSIKFLNFRSNFPTIKIPLSLAQMFST